MPTDCTPDLFGFAAVEGREVVAGFDGGSISSDAGGLLLGASDRAIRLVDHDPIMAVLAGKQKSLDIMAGEKGMLTSKTRASEQPPLAAN
jgi:hypothetical protein